MSKEPLPQSIADLPAQRASAPKSKAEARARYFNTGNAFNLQLPTVPDESFVEEPAKALDPDTPTGLIACDRSQQLGCTFPATTPLVLARYARIRRRRNPGNELRRERRHRVRHRGQRFDGVRRGAPRVAGRRHVRAARRASRTCIAPARPTRSSGSSPTSRSSRSRTCSRPRPARRRPTSSTSPPAKWRSRSSSSIGSAAARTSPGSALIFSSERQEAIRNVLPTLTVAMNSLPGGKSQRPHRHNSVAVSLVIQGERCYSIVDGRRKDWSQWATTVTPATSVHSHHNAGSKTAMFLIVQDGGIYYHTRALGFEFVDA